MTHVTCRLTAKNRGQLRIRSVIEYGLFLLFTGIAIESESVVGVEFSAPLNTV